MREKANVQQKLAMKEKELKMVEHAISCREQQQTQEIRDRVSPKWCAVVCYYIRDPPGLQSTTNAREPVGFKSIHCGLYAC